MMNFLQKLIIPKLNINIFTKHIDILQITYNLVLNDKFSYKFTMPTNSYVHFIDNNQLKYHN